MLKAAQVSSLWIDGSKPQSPFGGGARRVGDVNLRAMDYRINSPLERGGAERRGVLY